MKKTPRLLDEVRDVMRLHHYSIHAERAYCDWIKRCVLRHRMTSRVDIKGVKQRLRNFSLSSCCRRASRSINSESVHECLGFPLQEGLERAPGGCRRRGSRP